MKNEDFLSLTEQERTAKFKAVLNTRSQGGLTGDEIQEILHVLSADKQYEILIYHKMDEFCQKITRMKGIKKRLILGQGFRNKAGNLVCDVPSQAVAIAVWKNTSLEECSQLHVLIPPERCRKEQECL